MKVEPYQWIEDVKLAMSRLDSYAIPSDDRKTIYRCLETERDAAIERRESQLAVQNSGKSWSDDEIQTIKDRLGETGVRLEYRKFHHIIEQLSDQFCRKRNTVCKKAKSLGYDINWRL